jgi:hypothetical protein
MELNDEILTIQELAEGLKVKKSTIYDLTRNRVFPHLGHSHHMEPQKKAPGETRNPIS